MFVFIPIILIGLVIGFCLLGIMQIANSAIQEIKYYFDRKDWNEVLSAAGTVMLALMLCFELLGFFYSSAALFLK